MKALIEVKNADLGELHGLFLGNSGVSVRRPKRAFPAQLALREVRGGVLELFILDELPDQLPARILLFHLGIRRLLMDGQQAAALDVDEIGRHHDKLAGHIDVQDFEGADVFEILFRDPLNGNGMNVHLVLFDQVKEEIQGAFEDLEFHFVVGFHAVGFEYRNRGCRRAVG